MKTMRLILIVFIISMTKGLEASSIDEIRKSYIKAVEDPSLTERLSSELKKISKPDAITLAYIGSLEALKAKHSWNPYQKLSYMAEFDRIMNEAVRRMPENMEIRFLRYTIQYNTPSFLGYSKNIDEDKKVIIDSFIKKKFVTSNKVLITDVYKFMVETKSVSVDEKVKMDKVIRGL